MRFVSHNRPTETIDRALYRPAGDAVAAETDVTRPLRDASADVDEHGAMIREAFAAAAIPCDVERSLLDRYRELGQGRMALRSSTTAEDLPEAAFAGQHDTILNVVGKEELLDAVRRCWASLWTDRAIA